MEDEPAPSDPVSSSTKVPSLSLHRSETRPSKKLRSACDFCHQTKTKCVGGCPCEGCQKLGIECVYSASNRIGRPKGTRNKKTREYIERHRAVVRIDADERGPTPSEVAVDTPPGIRESPSQELMVSKFPMDISRKSLGVVSSPVDDLSTGILIDNDIETFPFCAGTDEFWSSFRADNAGDDSVIFNKATHSMDHFNASRLDEIGQSSSCGSTGVSGNRETTVDCSNLSPYTSLASNLEDDSETDNNSIPSNNFALDEARKTQDPIHWMAFSEPSLSILPPLSCQCLQQQTELLHCLKRLKRRHDTSEIDVALANAQRALAIWRRFLECKSCQLNEYHDANETLILSFINIRIVLQTLRYLCMSNDGRNKQCSRRTARSGLRSTIGLYRTSREENALILDLLISQIADKISIVVRCLEEKLKCARGKATVIEPSNIGMLPPQMYVQESAMLDKEASMHDFDYVQKMVKSSENTIRVLKENLQSQSST